MDNNTIEPPILKRAKYVVKCSTPEAIVLGVEDYIYLDVYADSDAEAFEKTIDACSEANLDTVMIVGYKVLNVIKLKWSV